MSFLSRVSRTHLLVGGLLTYATGVSLAVTFFPSKSSPSPNAAAAAADPNSPSSSPRFPSEDVRRTTFDGLATGYDKEVGLHEYLLGIQRRRKRLVKQAKGRVLEIASGTGRNVDFYTQGCCNEIVFSDFSQGMMDVLKEKVAQSDLGKRYDYQIRRQQQLEQERRARIRAAAPNTATAAAAIAAEDSEPPSVVETQLRFQTMNAAAMPYEDDSFDTVIDTFGLCSFEDPIKVLEEMKRVLKPGGQLLLLEHGNSDWGFMKDMQAKHLDRHVHKYGCYWNREIEGLLTEAGLKVREVERSQLGTLYYIVAE